MDSMFALVVVLSIFLIFTLYFCIKFALIIIRMQNAIEYSLDVIDQKYSSLSRILEIPIFYNSDEVKRAINDLEDARNSLLDIANELTSTNISKEDSIEYYDGKEEEEA